MRTGPSATPAYINDRRIGDHAPPVLAYRHGRGAAAAAPITLMRTSRAALSCPIAAQIGGSVRPAQVEADHAA